MNWGGNLWRGEEGEGGLDSDDGRSARGASQRVSRRARLVRTEPLELGGVDRDPLVSESDRLLSALLWTGWIVRNKHARTVKTKEWSRTMKLTRLE
jgi:hypothetical protein